MARFLPLCAGGLLVSGVALALLPGCAILRIISSEEKPSAKVRGVRFEDLSLDSVTLVFDVELSNPYDVALPLVDLDYRLESRQEEILRGKAPVTGHVPPESSRSIDLPARISFAKLLEVLRGIRPGAVIPYLAHLDISVEAPVVGRLSLPLEKEGQVPIPTVPSVELQSIRWDTLSLTEAKAVIEVRVVNRNEFPFELSQVQYSLSSESAKLAESTLETQGQLGSGEAKNLSLSLAFKPIALGPAAYRLLSGKKSSFKLAGQLSAKTPFGALQMPFGQESPSGTTR